MPDVLTPDEFLAGPPDAPIIDVRTPAEFALGHIPGAINVPLFSDAERAEIGCAYRHDGRHVAVCLGLRHVGPRLEQLARSLLELTDPAAPHLRLHCWRGGMRSGSVAWLMESTFGCQVTTLNGGYKAFRHWVLASFAIPRNLRVVAGLTGSGKTAILHQLDHLGAATIDLEALAHHKGSAFGNLGELPQPTQAQFENSLALAWRATRADQPVWLEDESRMIGKRALPEALWLQKQNAQLHVVDLPDEQRVNHLCDVYAGFPAADLAAHIATIRSRLGGGRAKSAVEALDQGDFAAACRIILSYYDRAYQNCLALYPPQRITRHGFTRLQPDAIAAALLDASTRPPPPTSHPPP